jgi:hypothetical protein
MKSEKDILRKNTGPALGGKKMRMSVFTSFEEAEESNYEFYRNLTPVERMQMHYELSMRIWGKAQPSLNRRFTFD